ncbi:MAG: hypothetical protein ACRDF4_10340, partial [Rhabdochlamydiaceae bacterium]
VKIGEKERSAVLEIANKVGDLGDPQDIQALIFETARSSGLEPNELFGALYRILLGVERGPRLGQYILDMGSAKVAERLKHSIESQSGNAGP